MLAFRRSWHTSRATWICSSWVLFAAFNEAPQSQLFVPVPKNSTAVEASTLTARRVDQKDKNARSTEGEPKQTTGHLSHHEDDVLRGVIADGELEELDLVLVGRQGAQKVCTANAKKSARRNRNKKNARQAAVSRASDRAVFCFSSQPPSPRLAGDIRLHLPVSHTPVCKFGRQ